MSYSFCDKTSVLSSIVNIFCNLLLSVLLAAALLQPVFATAIEFTDMTGRHVSLDHAPERIVLADSRMLTVFSLISSQPVERIVGLDNSLKRFDPITWQAYLKQFPQLSRITDIGSVISLSPERIIALEPDLVLLPVWSGNRYTLEHALQKSGIAFAYLDFISDPVGSMASGMRLAGIILQRQQQAQAYIQFYNQHLERITTRLAERSYDRPTVFVHNRYPGPGEGCCWSLAGKIGELVEFAGGNNIIHNLAGIRDYKNVSLEFVLQSDPDIYLIAGGARPDINSFPLGEGVQMSAVQQAFSRIRQEQGFSQLTAVTKGQSHAMWLFLFNSPLHIVSLEAMAKWFHPQLFTDIDPVATLQEINNSFLAVPMRGIFLADDESSD